MRTRIAIMIAGLICACSSPQPTTPKDTASTAQPMTADEEARWYQDCWNDFSQHKWDDFKKCYADSATSQQLGYGKATATGADAIVGSSQEFVTMFPDGRGEVQLILINGAHIASASILKGSQPGTGKKFGLMFGHSIDIDPVARKVTKEIGVMDGATMAAQLGLSPVPARPVIENGESSPTIVIAKNDDTETKNVEADKLQLEAWNKHDLKTVQMYEADDIVFHDMTAPKDQNKKEADAGAQMLWKAFSDAKLNISSIWGAGDYVAFIGELNGTNDGNFPPMNLKKTDKKVAIPFFEIDRLENGKTKEVWLFFDAANMASQLGAKAN